MTTEPNNASRIMDAALPEDLEPAAIAPTPGEVPAAEILPAERARALATGRGGALAFLSVFRHRNYRLFFSGQLISLMGTWITNVTQGWLVYNLTHSTVLLGMT